MNTYQKKIWFLIVKIAIKIDKNRKAFLMRSKNEFDYKYFKCYVKDVLYLRYKTSLVM